MITNKELEIIEKNVIGGITFDSDLILQLIKEIKHLRKCNSDLGWMISPDRSGA